MVALCSHVELQKLNAELAGLESSYTAMQETLFKQLCEKVKCQGILLLVSIISWIYNR